MRTKKYIPKETIRLVRSRCYLKGITPPVIAREARRSINTVYVVWNGFRKSHHIQTVISRLVKEDHKKLWGKAA